MYSTNACFLQLVGVNDSETGFYQAKMAMLNFYEWAFLRDGISGDMEELFYNLFFLEIGIHDGSRITDYASIRQACLCRFNETCIFFAPSLLFVLSKRITSSSICNVSVLIIRCSPDSLYCHELF